MWLYILEASNRGALLLTVVLVLLLEEGRQPNMLIFGIMASVLLKFRTMLFKIVQSEVLIKLATVPASNIKMALFGGRPVEGVTETIASSGHYI